MSITVYQPGHKKDCQKTLKYTGQKLVFNPPMYKHKCKDCGVYTDEVEILNEEGIVKHPNDIKWNESPLPNVNNVPKDCSILLWVVYENDKRQLISQEIEPENGTLMSIRLSRPAENELNPLHWDNGDVKWHLDSDGVTRSFRSRVEYWAWINRGTK